MTEKILRPIYESRSSHLEPAGILMTADDYLEASRNCIHRHTDESDEDFVKRVVKAINSSEAFFYGVRVFLKLSGEPQVIYTPDLASRLAKHNDA